MTARAYLILAALFLRLLVLVGATIDDPAQWPGLNNLPNCVQNVFGGCLYDCSYGGGCIPCYVGCGDWTCACNQFPAAVSAASSVAASGCSTTQADIASATSILNGFCGQLLATPTGPTAPTSAPTPTTTAGSSSNVDSGNGAPPPGGGGWSVMNKIALGVGLPGAILAALLIWQIIKRAYARKNMQEVLGDQETRRRQKTRSHLKDDF